MASLRAHVSQAPKAILSEWNSALLITTGYFRQENGGYGGTRAATFQGMILTLGLLAVLLSGSAVMFVGLRNAPEGYEADGQFHIVWRNDRPDVSNIVCIWSGQNVETSISIPRQIAA